MFFLRYLGGEIRSRARQAFAIALGLAVGVGLVVTVTAASAGVSDAQAGVLKGLYGVGTDVTVTKPPPPQPTPGSGGGGGGGMRISAGANGKPQVCLSGKCSSGAQTIDTLTSSSYSPLSYSDVSSISKLPGVAAAGAGLDLTDRVMTLPADMGSGGGMPTSNSFDVEGVDFTHSKLGPLTDGTFTSGHNFTNADANSNDAVVDSNYAKANNLKVGGTITMAKKKFTIIGLVSQPQGAKPPDAYIPLARAQALGTSQGNALTGKVNTIYVTAASSADIPAVQKEIQKQLPSATVTTPASLASEVTGSLSSTSKLANDLGRWLSILVLIAAFAVAALLTVAAVGRRVREFGTLKAIGWRSRRIVVQVMGEAVVMGAIGAAIGVGLGFAGTAIVNQIAPKLSATYQTPSGQHAMMMGANGPTSTTSTVAHTVSVPMAASVSGGMLVLAIVLAIAGALIAGIAGSYQISRLRPVDALARVA
ncbi:MAG: ABC transporter permease [Nocardiopsaceae bacterium]|nr:ABC transporter permease [Nocardiopsaceae bacterium]